MQRSDFTSLPLSVALGIVWDSLCEEPSTAEWLAGLPVPEKVRAPRFDSAIYRKEGVTFASEYDLEGLRFWHARAEQSAASGGQWAEKDAKQAKALGYWIAYREQQPDAVWTGERNREQVTAKRPMAKPEVYPRDTQRAPAPSKQYGAEYDAKDEDDELPFINNVSCEAGERWWR